MDAGTVGAATAVPERARLAYSEANPLAAALVCRIAAERDIRMLVIKGLSLEHHGLRAGHVSADVDLLVDPARFGELLDAITGVGWRLRPTTSGGRLMTHHSVTLLHPAWPNDIDVHTTFPGLLAGPEASFEVLWRNRAEASLASVSCWIPDRPSAIVIWALHSLRGSARQSRHESELRQLVVDVVPTLAEVERRRLGDRIVELGADRPLREVPELAVLSGDRHGPVADGEWDAWQAKLAQARDASPWLQVLRAARPRERPRILAMAVWPSRRDLELLDPTTVATPIGRLHARLRRFGRLLRRVLERAAS